MDLVKLQNAGIDVEDGLRRFMKSEQMFEKFLKKFLDNDLYAAFQKEADTPDATAEQLFERAHALKGVCANLSMTGIIEVLGPMVETLRAGALTGVREQMPELDKRYQMVVSVIREL